MILFTIYDSVSKTHSSPYVSPNIDCAIRDVKAVASDPASYWYKNPDDYSLIVIADYEPTNSCPVIMRDLDNVEEFKISDILAKKEVM